ncbi:MAG: dTDP-4-dehydrorhamnose reductase [Burkholderiales bacterium]
MKTILLIGKNGQVGWELQRTLAPLGNVVATGSLELNLADPDSIRKNVREIRPDLIVNAGAYTAVDRAESEPEIAMKINGIAPGILAEEAARLGALQVHYSTDYVFDGTKNGAYLEADSPNPLSVYGKTKLAGEEAIRNAGARHLIFRTSWVYGMRGHNFLLTILRLARERDELRIIDDQIGAPTWSRMIAEASSIALAGFREGLEGTYHLTSKGATTWHGFTQAILENSPLEKKPKLVSIPTEDYPLPAPRPKNSILSNEKLHSAFGISLPDWRISLALCMERT